MQNKLSIGCFHFQFIVSERSVNILDIIIHTNKISGVNNEEFRHHFFFFRSDGNIKQKMNIVASQWVISNCYLSQMEMIYFGHIPSAISDVRKTIPYTIIH